MVGGAVALVMDKTATVAVDKMLADKAVTAYEATADEATTVDEATVVIAAVGLPFLWRLSWLSWLPL